MKVTSTASSIRAIFTATEVRDLVYLAEDAARRGMPISERLTDAIADLDQARRTVEAKRASKRYEKQRAQDAERRLRELHHYAMIGDYAVMATRADYADLSSDPDHRLWADVMMREILNKPLPDQCEIRRDAWLVRVTRPVPGDIGESVGSDCTETSERAEIATVAERLIGRHAQVPA
ncbi:hypothetical protein Swit_2214 [Rhizorhabdus wittichii RW1]|uniref:Uncharacterized protein n=1 Tax=Rhizorhabdus wittichii (strain DSM 6014 / CCUG 31198 / JCM 15750 / NBRC 105917 / EY 4224 / RW1) TaxID=392499 RepID=A0A9J9HBM4_RHIWR|nr:hypothetical protein Swit_2214 [Rhizorhabdus wittichii RW1]